MHPSAPGAAAPGAAAPEAAAPDAALGAGGIALDVEPGLLMDRETDTVAAAAATGESCV